MVHKLVMPFRKSKEKRQRKRAAVRGAIGAVVYLTIVRKIGSLRLIYNPVKTPFRIEPEKPGGGLGERSELRRISTDRRSLP